MNLRDQTRGAEVFPLANLIYRLEFPNAASIGFCGWCAVFAYSHALPTYLMVRPRVSSDLDDCVIEPQKSDTPE